MNVAFKVRENKGIVILDVTGIITLGEGSRSFTKVIRGLIAKGKKKVILNLAEMTYADFAGIKALKDGITALANQGGALKILGISNRMKDLLQIVKIFSIFEVFDDEESAVRSFLQ